MVQMNKNSKKKNNPTITTTTITNTNTSPFPIRLLFQPSTFMSQSPYDPPHWISQIITGIVFLTILQLNELFVTYMLLNYHPNPIFYTNPLHCQIIARYIGVDALCCIIVSYMGMDAIYHSSFLYRTNLVDGNKKQQQKHEQQQYQHYNNKPLNYSQRLYQYYPLQYRVTLFFAYYQMKDIIDSILWNDKVELIFHHIISFLSAIGCLSSTTGLYYAPFFFGISELSTIVLCCLVNFDTELGITGLAEEYPTIKMIIGIVFIVLFLLCRCIAWPIISYSFCSDVLQAIRAQNQPKSKQPPPSQQQQQQQDPQFTKRKFWIYYFLVALSSLSILQVLWLGEIIRTVRKEFHL